MDMALVGTLHPLLVHFPIGLILAAAAAELVAIHTGRADWRAIAVANARAGAAMGASQPWRDGGWPPRHSSSPRACSPGMAGWGRGPWPRSVRPCGDRRQ